MSWPLLPVQYHKPPPIGLQALSLSDRIFWMYLSLPLYNHKGLDLTCVKYINALFQLEKSSPKLSSEKYRELYLLYGKYMKYSCLMFDCLAQILISESLKILYFMHTNLENFHMWIAEVSYFTWEHFFQDFQMWNTQNSTSHNRRLSFKLSWWKCKILHGSSMKICGQIQYCL